MEDLRMLLDALAPDQSSGPRLVVESPTPASNVYPLKFPEQIENGEPFTPAERQKLRAMMEAFSAIQTVCPIARMAKP